MLAGEPGAVRDAVLLNAGAALAVYEIDLGADLDTRLAAGIAQATASLDSGAAAATLDRWVAASQSSST
jgi:anthranilate phosphoribosyltransferase